MYSISKEGNLKISLMFIFEVLHYHRLMELNILEQQYIVVKVDLSKIFYRKVTDYYIYFCFVSVKDSLDNKNGKVILYL